MFVYSPDNGNSWEKIRIPEGSYEIDYVNNTIHHEMEKKRTSQSNQRKTFILKFPQTLESGSGIFDTIANFLTRIFTGSAAKQIASSTLDVGKSVTKEGAKKALEVGKSATVDAEKKLVKKSSHQTKIEENFTKNTQPKTLMR